MGGGFSGWKKRIIIVYGNLRMPNNIFKEKIYGVSSVSYTVFLSLSLYLPPSPPPKIKLHQRINQLFFLERGGWKEENLFPFFPPYARAVRQIQLGSRPAAPNLLRLNYGWRREKEGGEGERERERQRKRGRRKMI